jgi:hypothetical protein
MKTTTCLPEDVAIGDDVAIRDGTIGTGPSSPRDGARRWTYSVSLFMEDSALPSLRMLTIRSTPLSFSLNIHACTYLYCLLRLKIDEMPTKTRFWLELN